MSRIIAKSHPFAEPVQAPIEPGILLGEFIEARHPVVSINGEKRDDWPDYTIQRGDEIVIVGIPAGDDIGQLLVTIAVIVASFYVGNFAAELFKTGSRLSKFAGALAQSTTLVVGNLISAAIFKPPTPDAGEARRAFNQLTGGSNQNIAGQAVPIGYGLRRTYPPLAAAPYTEVIGEDQYLNQLFCVGIGEYEISQPKIGDTLLENFQGVELIETTSPTFPFISELNLSTVLQDPLEPANPDAPITTATFTTAADVEAISADFVSPALLYITSKGKRRNVNLDFRIEFRAAGSSDAWQNVRQLTSGDGAGPSGRDFSWPDWTIGNESILGAFTPQAGPVPDSVGPLTVSPRNGSDFRVSGRTQDAVRFGVKWEVPEGQYDVRVTRTYLGQDEDFPGTDIELAKYGQGFTWYALRSHNTNEAPINLSVPCTYLRLRIKASGQLNNAVSEFSVLRQRKLPIWDGSSWSAPVATRNAAWAAADVLFGDGNFDAPELDDAANYAFLDELLDFANHCDAESFYFDLDFDAQRSVHEALSKCLQNAKGAWNYRSGKYSFYYEDGVTTASQLFSPRNSSNYEGIRVYAEYPHGLRVRFNNEAADYKLDSILVYDDGYSESNATLFEEITIEGVTTADQAWRMGRYFIAEAKLRPEQHFFDTDFEYLAIVPGDVIEFAHDVPLFGVAAARIKSYFERLVVIDEKIILQGQLSYRVTVRHEDGTLASYDIETVENDGEYDRFYLSAAAPAIVGGELCKIGAVGLETRLMKVLTIDPRPNAAARVTCVDLAPEILTADTGAIPSFDPGITLPQNIATIVPPLPNLLTVSSSGVTQTLTPNGSRLARMVIAFTLQGFTGAGVGEIEARIRPELNTANTGTHSWRSLPRVAWNASSLSTIDVEVGVTYEVQLRAISFYGVASDWTATTVHQVDTNTAAPVAPAGLSVVSQPGALQLNVDTTNIDYPDIDRLEVAIATTNDRSTATFQSVSSPARMDVVDELVRLVGVSDQGDRFFWVRFVDQLENLGDWFPSSETAGVQGNAQAGTGTPLLRLTSNGLAFKYDGAGVLIEPNSISFNALLQNISGAVVWATNPPNLLSSVTAQTAVLTAADFGSNTSVEVSATAGGITDQITVLRVADGNDGTDGNDGNDGDDGEPGVATRTLYRRAATQPATPSQVASPAGWSVGIPADDGNPAWSTSADFLGTAIASVWSTPALVTTSIPVGGQTGASIAGGAADPGPQITLSNGDEVRIEGNVAVLYTLGANASAASSASNVRIGARLYEKVGAAAATLIRETVLDASFTQSRPANEPDSFVFGMAVNETRQPGNVTVNYYVDVFATANTGGSQSNVAVAISGGTLRLVPIKS